MISMFFKPHQILLDVCLNLKPYSGQMWAK